MYVAGLDSLFDEAGWGSDAHGFSSSLYKLQAGFRTRGSISGFDTDYYQIAGLAPAVAASDLTAPTVEVADNSPGTAIGNVTYTLTFSESVTGLATDDFGVINGSVTSVSGSGNVYNVVVTPAANFEGNLSLTLLAGAVTDLAGNLSAASAAAAQAIDTKAPTVSITDNLAGVANTSTASVVYTLTFSEPILGLDGSDLVASNIAGGTLSGSGTTWTVTLTPKAGVASGSMGLTLKANAVTDVAGNPNAAASNNSQAIDTVAPVAPKLVTGSSFYSLVDPQVTFHTTLGDVVMEFDPTHAPVTVANVLAYVDTGYYSGTLFHRVIPGFMAQGGGFSSGMVYKAPTYDPIVLESNNGLLNLRGTVAMARTPAPDSATSQFFVNLVDNAFLDYSSAADPGYAVFGRVVAGMSVIDNMALVPTGTIVPHANVPQTEIVISSAQQTVAGSSITNSAVFQVQGLEGEATWEYSLNGGVSWLAGSGSSITVPGGSYAANAIQVRQTDAAGNLSAGVGHYGSALAIDTTAPSVSAFSPSDDAANVNVGSNIAVVFNEAIRRGTGSIVLKAADGTVVATYDSATSANLSVSGNTLTIDPSADLDYSTGYVVEFAAGSIKDLAGNVYVGTATYNFTTASPPITGQPINGGDGADSLVGTVGNDTVAGGGGNDSYTFTGTRSQYTLTSTVTGYQAHDGIPGRDGTDLISGVETLVFRRFDSGPDDGTKGGHHIGPRFEDSGRTLRRVLQSHSGGCGLALLDRPG